MGTGVASGRGDAWGNVCSQHLARPRLPGAPVGVWGPGCQPLAGSLGQDLLQSAVNPGWLGGQAGRAACAEVMENTGL